MNYVKRCIILHAASKHKVSLFFFSTPLVVFVLWMCCCASVLPSRVVPRPQSWPCCSESVGCGGPERLTLTSNPPGTRCWLSSAEQVKWALCPKELTCTSVIWACREITCTSGWAPPHYPMYSQDKRAWHSPKPSHSHRSFSRGYFIIHVNVNACQISDCIDSTVKCLELPPHIQRIGLDLAPASRVAVCVHNTPGHFG